MTTSEAQLRQAVLDQLRTARAYVSGARQQLAASVWADLTGLEDSIRAIYDGVQALPEGEAPPLIEALVALQRELRTLSEELDARCREAVGRRIEAPARRAAVEAYVKARDHA